MLTLCSCKAAVSDKDITREQLIEQARFYTNKNLEQNQISKQELQAKELPALYQTDSHTPPPAIRQAEYAEGINVGCPCGACSNSCCPPLPCSNQCAIQGPKDEYLCDGGDGGLPVGVREDWKIDGLEQEDTVAHYDTVDGKTFVTPSNKVCVYAPRFGAVRRVINLNEYARYDMPNGFDNPLRVVKLEENEEVLATKSQIEPSINRKDELLSTLDERQKLGELGQEVQLLEFDGSLAPYANLQIVRTGLAVNEEKALVARSSLSAITWTGDQAAQVTIDSDQAQEAVVDQQPGIVYHTKDPTKPRLRLIKLASKSAAKQGEEIEFTLRFDNIGSQEMGNVTIVDNLTTRLEYVPDSAKSSVEADFSTESNSAGSLVLRWEIKDPLPAGKGGILQFKCKVR